MWKSCFRNDLFQGKVALVSGGGTGIGKSVTIELASLGATVVIASRKEESCQQAADEINKLGFTGKVFAGPSTNIRKEEDIQQLIEHIVEKYGSIDLLVNNAGGQFVVDSADLSKRGFAAVVDTNLQGTFVMCREAYNQYMRDHGGSIVNITIGERVPLHPTAKACAPSHISYLNAKSNRESEWYARDGPFCSGTGWC